MKNNLCLFESPFKIQKNGVFLFEISFFVLEISTFFYYANLISDDVILRATKMWKTLNKRYLWKYWSSVLETWHETKWPPQCCCHDNSFAAGAVLISNSNWTEWSTIPRVIARVISKSDEREARGRFEITSTITPWIVRHEVQLLINRIYNKFRN